MPGLADRIGIEAFLNAHEPLHEPTLYVAGNEIGDWRVATFLGRGGSGEVYRVAHKQLGVPAAMKVLSRDDGASRDRFLREARILAEHSHPAFPRFLGYGEIGNHAYLVIELLEPLPLPSTDREVARYLCRVCEGVAFLHGLGLVHRDIKPQNVLQRGETGQPVLIDLGLVKDTTLSPVHADISLSIVDGKTMGVGTPKYSAPEQFAGGKISPAADVHALGMLANECFGGRPPRAWERIIRRSTSSIPSQRYATVEEFVRAVRSRHSTRTVVACLIPVALAVLAAVVWIARTSVLREVHRMSVQDGPKIAVTKDEVVEQITNQILTTNSERRVVVQKEKVKKPPAPTYPQSGAFSGDAAVDSDL